MLQRYYSTDTLPYGERLGYNTGDKKVPNHGDIGDLEDWRLIIFIDRDDRARTLHSDDVLDRAADSECEIELRRNRLA